MAELVVDLWYVGEVSGYEYGFRTSVRVSG